MDGIKSLFLVILLLFSGAALGEVSCECPQLKCDACSLNKGTTFYSEKCGPGNTQVRSCAKPTCVPLTYPTAACPQLPESDTKGAALTDTAVAPAPTAIEPVAGIPSAGKIKVLNGSVVIVGADGKKRTVVATADVFEKDRLESGKASSAIVDFAGGNKLHVLPETKIEVREYQAPGEEASRRALLHLIKGKVRSQVEQKYNGTTSYYRVTTRGAVAGVRGTDFVVTYNEKARAETRVETLNGRVDLSRQDTGAALTIRRGQAGSFFSEINDPGLQDPLASGGIRSGMFSDVVKISDEQLKVLDRDSRADRLATSKIPRADIPICDTPKAFLDQCVWRCVGNPSKDTRCRTDLAEVSCIRSRCDANGKWSDSTKLNAPSARSHCVGVDPVVKNCDY